MLQSYGDLSFVHLFWNIL